jgi:hypothetical protein
MNEIERRIQQVEAGRRDPLKDFNNACEEVKKAHESFKSSKDKQGHASVNASERYARALQEMDITTRVRDLTNALEETA